MNWPLIAALCVLGVVLFSSMIIAWRMGHRVGRRCECCNLNMDCRYCVAANCPAATRNELDPFTKPEHGGR